MNFSIGLPDADTSMIRRCASSRDKTDPDAAAREIAETRAPDFDRV